MKNALSLFVMMLTLSAGAQSDSLRVQISGRVVDINNPDGIMNLMVVNKNSHQGIFGDAFGNFSLKAGKNDTLLIACTGYTTRRICFRDSVYRTQYNVIIHMDRLRISLKEVQIFPERDLEEIHRDLESLGYNKRDYVLSGVDAFSSPITFLYQSYSRRERSKRLVAQYENEDRKRDLLKELLRRYVNGEIIKLEPEKFDEFIDYCKVPDSFMKTASQYDFIIFIKERYERYSQEYGW